MGNILVNSTKDAYKEGGAATAIIVFILLLGIIFGVLCGVIAIATALWNGVLVALFPMIPHITFWKMWGMYLLLDILIKPSSSSTKNN